MTHKAREKDGESVQSKPIAVLERVTLISKLAGGKTTSLFRSKESYRIFTNLVSWCSVAGCKGFIMS
jgi:hypothetical protein